MKPRLVLEKLERERLPYPDRPHENLVDERTGHWFVIVLVISVILWVSM